MTHGKQIETYRWLADHYDRVFAPALASLRKARTEILSGIFADVHSICDLGAGTGTTALEFARRGLKVYAVDLSPAMCRLARQKVRKLRLPVRVLQADMRSFRLPKHVELVICEGDALNHIPQKSDLVRVARSVFRTLCPGGWFYFDVNNALGFKRYWKGNVWVEKPGLVMVMRNSHTPDGQKAASDIDVFLRHGTRWKRHQERVEEVCWTADEIRHVFTQAGFDTVRAWDASRFFGPASPIKTGCRTMYLAHKPA